MNDERDALRADCEAVREWMVDSLPKRGPDERPAMESAANPPASPIAASHLLECADCRAEARAMRESWEALAALPELEPSPVLSSRFHAWLDGESAAESGRRTRSARSSWRLWPAGMAAAWPRWAWAATAAALVLGVSAGVLAGTAWRRPAQNAELASLREEVRTLNRLVTLSLLSQPDASDRLQGVSYGRAGAASQGDARVVDALIETLRFDENVNVRLAAVDALAAAAYDTGTRRRLESAFAEQQAPMVQIALVDVLLASGEQVGRDSLLQILASPSAARLDATVREHLRKRLSQPVNDA